MNDQLNVLLADLEVFYHKLQSFHWYVAGEMFFQIHAKLEVYYDMVSEQVDEVAEMILMNEEKPVSLLTDFKSLSNIQESKNEFHGEVDLVLKEVKNDFESLLMEVKAIKKAADEEDNYLVSAKMDDYISSYSKQIWMLKQFLYK